MSEPQPLLIHPKTSDFVVPSTSAGNIVMDRDEVIELHCTQGFRAPLKGTSIFASCVGNTEFTVNNESHEFSEFICNDVADHTAVLTNRTCTNGNIAEIGFKIDLRWFNLIEVCHDHIKAVTHWAHYQQSPPNQGFQRGYSRVSFVTGGFFKGMPINALYTRNRQRRTLSTLLNSKDLANEYVDNDGDLFLSRGHLAARSDFIYGAHQLASFYYLNAAPQWQTFNAGNWNSVEVGVRKYVNHRKIVVDIYTGTHGVLRMKDVNGNPRDIYLDDNRKQGVQRIPVPKIYYKVVIAKDIREGIVFIGVNNPHADIKEILKEYIFCNDISDQVNYIPWEKHDVLLGYSYACSVQEFEKFIKHLPPMPEIKSLLL